MSEPESDSEYPAVFISYSWTDPAYEDWVLRVAEELRNGYLLDVRIDKWHMGGPGADAIKYMESMVTDPNIQKVLIFSDCKYAERANARGDTGVGMEAQILTPELYAQGGGDGTPNKYAVVVTENDDEGKPCLPTFYKGRVFIDMTDESKRAEKLEEIQRWAYDRPVHVPPPIGGSAEFLSEGPSTGTGGQSRAAIGALINASPDAIRRAEDYVDRFIEGLSGFIPDQREDLIPMAEALGSAYAEAERFIQEVARARLGDRGHEILRRLFQGMSVYLRREWDGGADGIEQDWQTDPFDYLVPDLLNATIAALVAVNDFEGIAALTSVEYTRFKRAGHESSTFPFHHLQLGVHDRELNGSLERLRRQRGSLFQPVEHLQAAALLSLLAFRHKEQDSIYFGWYPSFVTEGARMFTGRALPVFALAASRSFASRLAGAFVYGVDEFVGFLKEVASMGINERRNCGLHSLDWPKIIDAEHLGTRP